MLAMLQMDMTAWVKAGTKERVGIIQDFVDPALTEFIETLVEEYCESTFPEQYISDKLTVESQ